MEAAALVVAIMAAFISGAALIHTIRSSRRERDDRREGLDLLRHQIEAEATDRREELDLIRSQIEDEAAHRAQQNRAAVDIVRHGVSWVEGRGEHEFGIVNGGPALARNIRYWPQSASGGRPVEPTLAHPHVLQGDGSSVNVKLNVPRPQHAPLWLMVSWEDGAGTHEERFCELHADPRAGQAG